jgi:hypothetical protein
LVAASAVQAAATPAAHAIVSAHADGALSVAVRNGRAGHGSFDLIECVRVVLCDLLGDDGRVLADADQE